MRLSGSAVGVAIAFVVVLMGSALAAASVGGGVGAGTRSGSPAPSYDATFQETGLPAGTNWSVHVSYVGCGCHGVHRTVTSDTPTITIPVTNGTYRYYLLRVPGYFVDVGARGSFNVSGADPPAISVTFQLFVPFPVNFTETGLPPGTLWTVSVAGNGQEQEWSLEHVTESATGTSLVFSLPNGTYRYTVSPVPGSFFTGPSHGKFTVSDASPPNISVGFVTPPTYAVTFTESGLAPGTNWSVRVFGTGGVRVHEMLSSTTAEITFSLPNGTFGYAVGEVLGYVVNGSSRGQVAVTGAPGSIAVTFHALAPGAFYPVTFLENGLALGTHWAVKVLATHTFGHSRRAEQSGNTTTLTFLLQNGTYRFQVPPIRGYTSKGSVGTFSVVGASPAEIVTNFTATPTYAVTFTESGLPNGTNWSVLVRTQPGGSSVWPVRVTETTNTTAITLDLPNGSYCYRFGSVAGYHITTGSRAGSFSVAGASPPGVSVGFSPRR